MLFRRFLNKRVSAIKMPEQNELIFGGFKGDWSPICCLKTTCWSQWSIYWLFSQGNIVDKVGSEIHIQNVRVQKLPGIPSVFMGLLRTVYAKLFCTIPQLVRTIVNKLCEFIFLNDPLHLLTREAIRAIFARWGLWVTKSSSAKSKFYWSRYRPSFRVAIPFLTNLSACFFIEIFSIMTKSAIGSLGSP